MSDCCCGRTTDQASVSCDEEVKAVDACCLGDDDCCSYSCEDDPYRGPKQTAVVDFLFLDLALCDRCQGADDRVYEAVRRCKPLLAACGFNLVLNQVLVDTEEKARLFRLSSSPTIRVNGVDICPDVVENDCGCCSDMADTAVTCRLFPFNDTYYEVPPTDLIIRGILEVVMQGQKPPAEEPYELPENLHQFFAGVDKKAEDGADRPFVPEERKRCCC